MSSGFQYNDKVSVTVDGRTFDGRIIHVSTARDNRTPYVVSYRDTGNNVQHRNCAASDLKRR